MITLLNLVSHNILFFIKFYNFFLVPFSILKETVSDKNEELKPLLTEENKSVKTSDNSLKKNSNKNKKIYSTSNSKKNKLFFLNFLKFNKKLKISEVGKFQIIVNNIILKSINKIISFLFKDVKVKLNFILKQNLKSLIKLLNTKQISYLSKQAKQLYE